MSAVNVREEDGENRLRWKRLTHCGDPKQEKSKGKEDLNHKDGGDCLDCFWK